MEEKLFDEELREEDTEEENDEMWEEDISEEWTEKEGLIVKLLMDFLMQGDSDTPNFLVKLSYFCWLKLFFFSLGVWMVFKLDFKRIERICFLAS